MNNNNDSAGTAARARALARLHYEANDFTLWAEQAGADYAAARLRAALDSYDNSKEEPTGA